MQRPLPEEYNPYFGKYIALVGDGPYADRLKENTQKTLQFFQQLPEEKHEYRYAPGKWTPKDVLMHCIDTERGMSFRALLAARGDSKTPIHTMDEDMFASNVDTSARSMYSLLAEFTAVRTATEMLLSNVPESKTMWTSSVVGYDTSVRAQAYIMLGHVQHHLNVLQERYL